jgi:hypothetical protein
MSYPDQQEIQARQEYWKETLEEFERDYYPVFAGFGYSRNTALQVYMLDQLESAVYLALNPDERNGRS